MLSSCRSISLEAFFEEKIFAAGVGSHDRKVGASMDMDFSACFSPDPNGIGCDVLYDAAVGNISRGSEWHPTLYGVQAENMLALTNLPDLQRVVQLLLKTQQYEVRDVPFEEVESALGKGHVPLMLIDWNVMEGVQGPYQGHFIVVTGFEEDHVFYHESGPRNPQPHRKVSKQRFIQAWESFGTDKDVIIIRGPKSSNHPARC